MNPSIDCRWSFLTHRAVILENRALRVVVLPELGARIWSIRYKPRDRELMWHNPRIPPRRVLFGAAYDDVWCGGWEEMFPNDAPGVILGERYPDHGEVWCMEWDWTPGTSDGEASLLLRCETPISAMCLERRIRLRGDEPRIYLELRLTNNSQVRFPFLWKTHAAFAISPGYRIDFPPMTVELEPAFSGTLEGAPERFAWPHAEIEGQQIDLRTVPPSSSRKVHFFYGTGYDQGWCAITDMAQRLSWGLTFSSQIYKSCWLFASFGGWRNYNVAVLEPSTTHPFQIERAIERQTAMEVAPREAIETRMIFQVRQGLVAVDGVGTNGDFR